MPWTGSPERLVSSFIFIFMFFLKMDDHWDERFGVWKQGYSEAQLKECLEEYAALNVWQIDPHTFDIRFIWVTPPKKKKWKQTKSLLLCCVLYLYYLITFLNVETLEVESIEVISWLQNKLYFWKFRCDFVLLQFFSLSQIYYGFDLGLIKTLLSLILYPCQ